MNTRSYPRTLQQAFGPYTSNQIEEPQREYDWQDKVVMTGCAIAFTAFLVIVFVWR